MNLWSRSPQSYKDLQSSGVLILPSGRQLQKYKNFVKQDTGINKDVFRWMANVAKQHNIPAAGYHGGLIHDETRIQQDLVMNCKGKSAELIGWIDTGEEGNNIRVAKSQSVEGALATEVFQVSFLGFTGFRFPVAHYPTEGITASEIYSIIYDIISELQTWGFKVNYILQDGGTQNREFMKLHFMDDKEAREKNFCSFNVVNPTMKIAHSQDFSHNIKKIRNAILSSGTQSFHTRNLQKSFNVITWSQWIAAANWDEKTNSRRINHKLTSSHLNPDSAEKMRNHLAEEVLDSNMLHLMKEYQKSLRKGQELDGAVDLLEQSSRLISIFRDRIPITSIHDKRIGTLLSIREWFRTWRAEGGSSSESKMKPSVKCLDDIDSLISTFTEIVKEHLKKFPGAEVYPSRFNSDIIENNFCQVRGLHNGNTTNPTYASYQCTMNSVILGQSSISRGRKSNAGIPSADPFNFHVQKQMKREPLKQITDNCQNKKIKFTPQSKKNTIAW